MMRLHVWQHVPVAAGGERALGALVRVAVVHALGDVAHEVLLEHRRRLRHVVARDKGALSRG